MKDTKQYIYGKHAVAEALRHMPQTVLEVLYVGTKDEEIAKLTSAATLTTRVIGADSLPKGVSETAVHQNVLAKVDMAKLMVDYKQFVQGLDVAKGTGLVLLGEVQDPQNVGAVIRSAAAFGFAGVLIPEHNQAPVTATVVKTSAGMAFRIPVIAIGNVNSTLEDLKKKGFWIYGLAGEGDTKLEDESFDAPTVLVLGNEGKGIREKTREHCDILLSIPTDERCESLNASVSTGIAMHAWYTKQ
jgi:23S rRNA (guanosine2251-2'-O)-methyltransferase